jgi:hypothetical protein
MTSTAWRDNVLGYIRSLAVPGEAGAFASVRGKPATTYGTCYANLTRHYLTGELPGQVSVDFLRRQQLAESGWFSGPELSDRSASLSPRHDTAHLRHHLTCTVLPVLQLGGVRPDHTLHEARAYLDPDRLRAWLDRVNLADAWFEGNNLLFVGQLLIYFMEAGEPAAARAIEIWFDWLDRTVDRATGLWGTDRGEHLAGAVFGGYHQLLVYYHQQHPIISPDRLIDGVLALQHHDGMFGTTRGGGACEDVDCVDILVNLYKRHDHRRADIRDTLRRCATQILALQLPDGGFPYKRAKRYIHMGMPLTDTPRNVSGMFPTWFRVHTLALIAQVIELDELKGRFWFTPALSMGWHDASLPAPRCDGTASAEAASDRARARRRYVRELLATQYHRFNHHVVRRLRPSRSRE